MKLHMRYAYYDAKTKVYVHSFGVCCIERLNRLKFVELLLNLVWESDYLPQEVSNSAKHTCFLVLF